ncbi:MAG: histone deacetylase [Terrimicrobiaceae bacterium]
MPPEFGKPVHSLTNPSTASSKMKLFHDPGFAAPLGKHIMPISKFALVAEEIRRELPEILIESPAPVREADLRRVHTSQYIRAIQSGKPRELAESQKFPWSPQLFPSVLLTNGGLLAAARQALEDGSSGALASGFHHACADHGEGFCTFNGLIVALEALKEEELIRTGAVLDLDLHYGNGTASLAVSRPWMRTLSIYGNDYWENKPFRDVTRRHHEDGPNHFSVPLVPTGHSDRDMLFNNLETHLPWLLGPEKPDILLYQAGADPLKDDPYSPLNLTHEDLKERDRMVFSFARSHSVPIAWVLAGGYTPDTSKVVEAHLNTARVWRQIFGVPAT